MTSLAHWLLSVDASGTSEQWGTAPGGATYAGWWSGVGDVQIGGEWWRGVQHRDGGSIADVGPVENSVGAPGVRARIRVSVTADGIRKLLTVDHGPIMATLRWAVSADGGSTWQVLPRKFTGRIANPAIADGVYEADIEASRGTVDRGVPRWWSHEQQVLRYPGDEGLAAASEIAQGQDIRWPP